MVIFYGHDVTDRPSPMVLTSPAQSRLEVSVRRNPALTMAEAMDAPAFKRFVCISVNSPSMSMVNFPCCVFSRV